MIYFSGSFDRWCSRSCISGSPGSVGKGLAAITMDKEYQQKRRGRWVRQPKDFGDSLARGKGLAACKSPAESSRNTNLQIHFSICTGCVARGTLLVSKSVRATVVINCTLSVSFFVLLSLYHHQSTLTAHPTPIPRLLALGLE